MPGGTRRPGWLSRWWVWVGSIVVAFVIGAVAGSIVGPIDGDDGDGVAVEVDLGRPGRYVALGDSYSAGEGLAPFRDGTQDIADGGYRCHRSTRFAYPLLLRFVQPTRSFFRACSGAVVENVFDVIQEHDGVPDLQGLQAKDGILTDDVVLVTLTMGGNDLEFAKVLRFCYENGPNCSDLPYEGYPSLREWATATVGDLKTSLASLYQGVRAATSPGTRILVLGYPPLFPPQAPPIYRPQSAFCTVLFNKWTAPERTMLRESGLMLNKTIFQATQQADADIEYVDIWPFFAGHEPCSTGGEWVRFFGVLNSAVREGSFHPREAGQAMMARIVACYLDVFPDATTPRTKTTNYAMTGCLATQTAEVVRGGTTATSR